MGWKDPEFRERWGLVVSSVQAFATLGAFLVAIVGVWRVAPIITYQVEKQRAERIPTAMAPTSGSELGTRFANEALAWWSPRVLAYARIVELVRTQEGRAGELSFQLLEGEDPGTGLRAPDLLIVAARLPGLDEEVLRVEVNDRAMQPGHFIQRQINHGFFEELDRATRRRVEAALEHYAKSHMLPRIPPPHVRADMSADEIADEIGLHQDDRVTAARQIPGLVEIIEDAARG